DRAGGKFSHGSAESLHRSEWYLPFGRAGFEVDGREHSPRGAVARQAGRPLKKSTEESVRRARLIRVVPVFRSTAAVRKLVARNESCLGRQCIAVDDQQMVGRVECGATPIHAAE